MQKEIETIRIASLAKNHQLLGINKPKYPLFSILRFEDLKQVTNISRTRLITDFYQVVLKKDCPGKLQYGQTTYDFDEGVMSFFAPKQVNILDPGEVLARSGWMLNIHPDFLRTFSLAQKLKDYRFFDYSMNEALILSQEEEQSIETIFRQIEKEYLLPIDNFSQDVVISNIELLLTYCNRYYNRQFILRKPNSKGILEKFERLLHQFFESEIPGNGLPTIGYFADTLNLSQNYLSDLLKQLTGQNAQQHIHDAIIEKAKERLSTTELPVSQIAYELGFDYPQSFSKLFKSKTSISPLAFRRSFN